MRNITLRQLALISLDERELRPRQVVIGIAATVGITWFELMHERLLLKAGVVPRVVTASTGEIDRSEHDDTQVPIAA
jgi:hypothetical protein